MNKLNSCRNFHVVPYVMDELGGGTMQGRVMNIITTRQQGAA